MSISRSIFLALLFCNLKKRLNESDLQKKPLINSRKEGCQIGALLAKSCSMLVKRAERANFANTSSFFGLSSI